jgi:hypothetical protein
MIVRRIVDLTLSKIVYEEIFYNPNRDNGSCI